MGSLSRSRTNMVFGKSATTNRTMKKSIYLLFATVFCCLSTGCASIESSQQKWSAQIAQWLPIGTTREDALRIMKQNGFECLNLNKDVICEKQLGFGGKKVNVSFDIENGQIRYAPIVHVVRTIHF